MAKSKLFRFLFKFWPPFIGLGINIKSISNDGKKVIVILKKRPWNANYYGTQYGGGIFCMTDGIHVLMLVDLLPKGFEIWDKSATINYLAKGKTKLIAECLISDEDLHTITEHFKVHTALNWTTGIDIKDIHGNIVAQVSRTLSIKKKKPL